MLTTFADALRTKAFLTRRTGIIGAQTPSRDTPGLRRGRVDWHGLSADSRNNWSSSARFPRANLKRLEGANPWRDSLVELPLQPLIFIWKKPAPAVCRCGTPARRICIV